MKTIYRSAIMLILSAGFFIQCDSLDKDIVPKENPEELLNIKNEIVTLPGNPVLINIGDVVNIQNSYSLNIKKDPEKGKATFNTQNAEIITYSPYPSFKEGTDYFILEILNDQQTVLDSDIVFIHVDDNTTTECSRAVYDYADTKLNTPIEVEVLNNDQLCPDKEYLLTVYSDPQNGEAVIVDNEIIKYFPNSNFQGTESFIYSLHVVSGSTINPLYALMEIVVGASNNCDLVIAKDDSYTVQTNQDYQYGDAYNMTVLSNDSFCADLSRVITIIEFPQNGTEIGVEGETIAYYPPSTDVSTTSQFTYQICQNNNCDQATVIVQNIPNSDTCPTTEYWSTVVAKNDSYTVQSTDTYQYGNKFQMSILNNDSFCDILPKEISILVHPQNGAEIGLEGDIIAYYPPNTDVSTTSEFIYQICQNDNCDQATVIVQNIPQ